MDINAINCYSTYKPMHPHTNTDAHTCEHAHTHTQTHTNTHTHTHTQVDLSVIVWQVVPYLTSTKM